MQNQVTFLFVFLLLPLTLLSHINYQDIKNSTDLSIATLTLSTTVADITAPGANDGSITVTPLSGTAPYTYAWSHNPSLTTGTASGLATGDYFLLVTDATGCTGVASERILEPLECDGSLFHIVKDVVNVEMDIHLVSVISSGLVSSNLFPINYQAQALDAFGFNQTDAYVYAIGRQNRHLIKIGAGAVAKDLGPLVGINPTLRYTGGTCRGNTFYFYGSGSPGALYSVDLTTLSVTTLSSALSFGQDIGYLQLGTDEYIVSVRAAKMGLYNLTNPAASAIYPIVQMTPDPMSVNNKFTALWVDDDQSIFVYNSSNGLTHRILTINNRFFAVDLGALGYAVSLTDGLNCLDGEPEITCDFSITYDITACDTGNGSGMIDIQPMGPNQPVTYYWTDGGNGEDRSNLLAGPYTVYAFDALGCYDTLSFVIPSCPTSNGVLTNPLPQKNKVAITEAEVQIHPNPSTHQFNINLVIPKGPAARFWLSDALGKPLPSFGSELFPEGVHQRQIDLSKYPSGVYFYHLRGTHVTQTGRLIKQ